MIHHTAARLRFLPSPNKRLAAFSLFFLRFALSLAASLRSDSLRSPPLLVLLLLALLVLVVSVLARDKIDNGPANVVAASISALDASGPY